MTLFITVGVSLAAVLAAFAIADLPVSRRRVLAFARRHSIAVTGGNGAQIIAYLAVTRRWRAAGLIVGGVLSVLPGLAEQRIGIKFPYLVAGWFAGALVAELRLARIEGDRRAASLVRRTASRYLPSPARWSVPLAAVACLTLMPLTVGFGSRGLSGHTFVVWTTAVIAVPPLVWITSRQVVHRPQPVAAPDLLQADDAIRSRSLHALTASGTTLLLYCVLSQSVVIAAANGMPAVAMVSTLVGLVGLPLLAWRMATAAWTVRPATA